MNHPSNLRGIGFMLLAGFVFVLNDSFMKLVLADLPPYEVLVLRGGFGAIFARTFPWFFTGIRQNGGAVLNRFVFLRAAVSRPAAILTYILALAQSAHWRCDGDFPDHAAAGYPGHGAYSSRTGLALADRLGNFGLCRGFAGGPAGPGHDFALCHAGLCDGSVCSLARSWPGATFQARCRPMLSTFVTILIVVAVSSALCGLHF